MRIFEHANLKNFKCPICGESIDKPVALIPIAGTKDGNIYKCTQVHVDCLDLTQIKKDGQIMFVQFVE